MCCVRALVVLIVLFPVGASVMVVEQIVNHVSFVVPARPTASGVAVLAERGGQVCELTL